MNREMLAVTVSVLILGFSGATFAGEDAQALFERANQYAARGQYDKAEAAYGEIIAENPESIHAHNRLGLVYAMSDFKIKEGMEHIITAIKLNPRFAIGYHNMGTLCYYLGIGDQALGYLATALKLSPQDAETLSTVGWYFLISKRDYEKAVPLMEQALSIDKRNIKAPFGLGLTHIENGNAGGVLEMITALRTAGHEELAYVLEEMLRRSRDSANQLSLNDLIEVSIRIEKNASRASDKLTEYDPISGRLVLVVGAKAAGLAAARSSRGSTLENDIFDGGL